jgi:hypothetical protein
MTDTSELLGQSDPRGLRGSARPAGVAERREPTTWPTPTRRPVREMLHGTLLVVAGPAGRAVAPYLPAATSGLVLVSGKQHATVSELRQCFPDLTLAAEPKGAGSAFATVQEPFVLPIGDGLFDWPLSRVLDGQLEAGASFAITPTGYLQAGDADPLRAAIDKLNALDRDDVLFYLPADPLWVAGDDRSQFVALLKQSRHPIGLALGADTDPQREKGVPAGMRDVCHEVPGVMPWRADLSAFDGLTHGANAAAFGLRGSQRHVVEPGHKGWANLADRTPRVLMVELLRFLRSGAIADRYAAVGGPACLCPVCQGKPLGRFVAREDAEADRHNVFSVLGLFGEMLASSTLRQAWWQGRLREAQVAHETVATLTGQPLKFEPVLDAWLGLGGGELPG